MPQNARKERTDLSVMFVIKETHEFTMDRNDVITGLVVTITHLCV